MKQILFALILVFFVVPMFDLVPPINKSTKTCLVTGASSGIGREISIQMAKRGWTVIGIGRDKKRLDSVAYQIREDKLDASFVPYTCDVSVQEEVQKISEEIKNRGLKPTLFFLNAGIGDVEKRFAPLAQENKKIFDTNYFGTVFWVDEWLKKVIEYGGGTFVATSSVSSLFAVPKTSGYSASKAAINKCFQSLRLTYHKDNIGFITVLPGPVDTNMLKVDRPVPFTHTAKYEAKYIVKKVFARRKEIEPSWFNSFFFRFLNCVPDSWALRLLEI